MTTKAPTEKALEFAKKLAARAGIDIPEDVANDATKCSEFIDELKKPSEKQLNLAERIAKEKGVAIPDDARKDRLKLSKWIDEVKS